MLIKTQDKKTIVNSDNVTTIKIDTEGISRNYAAVITAYFENGSEQVLGRYDDKSDATDKFDEFCKACGNRTFIFDF